MTSFFCYTANVYCHVKVQRELTRLHNVDGLRSCRRTSHVYTLNGAFKVRENMASIRLVFPLSLAHTCTAFCQLGAYTAYAFTFDDHYNSETSLFWLEAVNLIRTITIGLFAHLLRSYMCFTYARAVAAIVPQTSETRAHFDYFARMIA